MIVRFLLAAIVAGLLGGAFHTAVQAVKVAPIILEAETYENAGAEGAADAEAWAPEDGLERAFFTLISNAISGVGFSLLMAAGILLSGQPISPRSGLVWGAAGFIVFVLAPGVGLPPEVPGTEAAPLADRQIWWAATVTLTAAGLAMFAFKSGWSWMIVGLALIVAPHIYGAPQPVHHESLAPANLAAEFVVAAIVSAGLFWLFLGGVLGWLLPRALNNANSS